jgi:hypothetical protein
MAIPFVNFNVGAWHVTNGGLSALGKGFGDGTIGWTNGFKPANFLYLICLHDRVMK